jgi:hypothetical protein
MTFNDLRFNSQQVPLVLKQAEFENAFSFRSGQAIKIQLNKEMEKLFWRKSNLKTFPNFKRRIFDLFLNRINKELKFSKAVP